MSFKFHGNYCGPGWSDNKYQLSVKDGSTKPIDKLDTTCKKHDNKYAIAKSTSDLVKADNEFFAENISGNSKQIAAAIGVKYGNKILRMFPEKTTLLDQINQLITGRIAKSKRRNPRSKPSQTKEKEEPKFDPNQWKSNHVDMEFRVTDKGDMVPLSIKPQGRVKIMVPKTKPSMKRGKPHVFGQPKNSRGIGNNVNRPNVGHSRETALPLVILQENKNSNIRTMAKGKNNRKNKTTPVGVAYSKKTVNTKPRTSPIRDGIRVQHRELFTTVVGSTTFQSTKFELNPGLPCVFPWLARLARNFERYSIKDLQFMYISSRPTSDAGRVTLAFDPDAQNSKPVSKQELCQIEFESDNVWKSFDFHPKHNSSIHYIRGAAIAGTDIKTYDTGFLILGTDGMGSGATIGELYVRYNVELYKPHYNAYFGAKTLSGGTITQIAPLGTASVTTGYAPWKVNAAGTALTFCENYRGLLTARIEGNAIINNNFSLSSGSINNLDILINGGATISLGNWAIDAHNGSVLTLDQTLYSSAIVTFELHIAEYNGYATGEL